MLHENAMNKKNSSERKEPSTYERLLALPEGELELLKEKIFFICIADQEEADAVENKAVMTKELFEQITEHTVALGLNALTLALTEEHTELAGSCFRSRRTCRSRRRIMSRKALKRYWRVLTRNRIYGIRRSSTISTF